MPQKCLLSEFRENSYDPMNLNANIYETIAWFYILRLNKITIAIRKYWYSNSSKFINGEKRPPSIAAIV